MFLNNPEGGNNRNIPKNLSCSSKHPKPDYFCKQGYTLGYHPIGKGEGTRIPYNIRSPELHRWFSTWMTGTIGYRIAWTWKCIIQYIYYLVCSLVISKALQYSLYIVQLAIFPS